jgi:hypothetical protein
MERKTSCAGHSVEAVKEPLNPWRLVLYVLNTGIVAGVCNILGRLAVFCVRTVESCVAGEWHGCDGVKFLLWTGALVMLAPTIYGYAVLHDKANEWDKKGGG